MLRLENLHTFYGNAEALRGVDLVVKEGEVVCLIGNNGAGKSTTLMSISGVLRPRVGNIYFEQRVINALSPHEIVRMGISQVPEGRRIFPRLTVRENLEMGAYAATGRGSSDRGEQERRLGKVFELFPVLGEREHQLGGTLSGGEQQMLAIGRALMSRPKMLLLDEPSLGLAPIISSRIFKIIREINNEGVTILLVEQNAHAALNLSQRGYVLENGRIAAHGTGEELLRNEQVKRAYLGE
ncbi:MAG TPA: ABC transporter ATP-binding protein [Thermodesulfovibrionales bacterium]|nr:ABC transporter ATP-binding protein [Thermodesulfovibrionales bacterium]